MLKQEAINLEDTNLANYDSPEAKKARKDAAKTDRQYQGVGERPGLIIWRVENTRTADDVPNFGINRWPEDQYGQFFSGDSFIVLHTYQENRKLLYDVHFWLGKDSTQDEVGVAAYKTVEIDDLLDGAPVQHREVQGSESALFKTYFPSGLIYLNGGHASGFRPATPLEYKPRMFQVRSDAAKRVTAYEVAPKLSSMNQGDVFILDLGTRIYNFAGSSADGFERLKGTVLANNLRMGRGGSVTVTTELDEAFWKQVGGKGVQDIALTSTSAPVSVNDPKAVNIDDVSLYRLTDESGTLKFLKVHQGRVYPSMLRSKDVFVIDSGPEVFVWVGGESTSREQNEAMAYAVKYLKGAGKSASTPVTRVAQGQTSKSLDEVVFAGKMRKGWLARSLGTPEHDPTTELLESFVAVMGDLFAACVGGEREVAQQAQKEWNLIDRGAFEDRGESLPRGAPPSLSSASSQQPLPKQVEVRL